MNTKTLTLVSIGTILAAALVVGFMIARPATFVSSNSMPVFMGEELVVSKTTADKITAVISPSITKTVPRAQPVAQPKVAVPLPIFPPQISFRVLPQYPAAALERELAGTTILSVYVGMGGNAERVAVKSSSGASELDKSAVTAVSQWQFSPATQGGNAIASWFELPVRFSLK
jgi:protein TonB